MKIAVAVVLGLAFSAFCPAVATSVPLPAETKFVVGECSVNLLPTQRNIMPTVTFAGRTLSFAYRTDGWLQDEDGRRYGFHSEQTNAFAVLKKTAKGIRADYVHALYVGDGGDRRPVGVCSNEVVFADGVAGVRATLWPAEPGRYRFYASTIASQVIVFPEYSRKWVGTTLHLVASKELSYMNELTPHDLFDPNAWGMNVNGTGYVREMALANVPGVLRFTGSGDARFSSNRYRGGFEASAALVNGDRMHKPAWDKPVSFSYAVKMEK